MLERLLRDAAPDGADVEIAFQLAEPALFPVDSEPMRLAFEAIERGTGMTPVFQRSGGSIPIVADLAAKGITTIVSGFALADDDIHAPNESYRLESLELGERASPRAPEGVRGSSVIRRVLFTRGGLTESEHALVWCATGPDGEVLAESEEEAAELAVFPRSAVKPLQALPAVRDEVLEAYGLEDRHLALACASHGGTGQHIAVVEEVLHACGLAEHHLGCGPLDPRDPEADRRRRARGEQPSKIVHNCSGKHALALARCVHRGWPTRSYLEPGHPIQKGDARRGGRGGRPPAVERPLRRRRLRDARLPDPAGRAGAGVRQARVRRAWDQAATGWRAPCATTRSSWPSTARSTRS